MSLSAYFQRHRDTGTQRPRPTHRDTDVCASTHTHRHTHSNTRANSFASSLSGKPQVILFPAFMSLLSWWSLQVPKHQPTKRRNGARKESRINCTTLFCHRCLEEGWGRIRMLQGMSFDYLLVHTGLEFVTSERPESYDT